MIYTDKLPNNCHECIIKSGCCDEGMSGALCKLGAFNYVWQNNCDEPDEEEYDKLETTRHPNCPLILIEQWRLESCETCGDADCSGCIYKDNNWNMTCSDWYPKITIDNQK